MLPNLCHGRLVHLYAYMLAFGIDRFEIVSISKNRINARVGWPNDGRPDYDPDDETQQVSWDFVAHDLAKDGALKLLRVLSEAGCIDNDKITVSPQHILQMPAVTKALGDRADKAIEALLSCSVDMVDDGAFTDAFFFHF